MTGVRVLVCGGRDFFALDVVWGWLDRLDQALLRHRTVIGTIIHGGAPGADKLADMWAGCHEAERLRFDADWKRLGRADGPIRNQQMLDQGRPDMVLAFPGGVGTADMVRRARLADCPVLMVENGR